MWRPDGWGWRARIGLLVPHADICEEAEFMAMAPPGVSIHTTRVPFRGMGQGGTMAPSIGANPLRGYLEPPLLDHAAELLAYAPVQCICLAFTNTSFLGTVEDDRRLIERLEQRTHQIPVIDTCLAVLAAVQVLGARRLALINPPWVDAAMTQGGAAYFGGAGLEIVFAQSAGLPNDPRDVHPGTLFEWTRAHVPASADVVFVGGNGFRAIGMIEALEEDLQRPVLTANQVLFWYALQRIGSSARVGVRPRLRRAAAHRRVAPVHTSPGHPSHIVSFREPTERERSHYSYLWTTGGKPPPCAWRDVAPGVRMRVKGNPAR